MELPGAVLRPLGRVIGRSWKSPAAIKSDLAKQKIFKTYSRRARKQETYVWHMFPKDVGHLRRSSAALGGGQSAKKAS